MDDGSHDEPMTEEQITSQLQPLIGEINSQHFCYLLVNSWGAAGVGPEDVIEPVLRFMEQHTDIDFGLPGPLVHFMEGSVKTEETGSELYEELLTTSVRRKPVPYTVWMVNRILNLPLEPERRNRLIELLRETRQRCQDDPEMLDHIDGFLAYQAAKGF
jgi:hypothetical protein